MRNTHKYVTLVAMTRTKCNIIYTYLISSWALRYFTYHQTSNISCTLVGNIIVDHSDVVGASPIGAAPNTSLFSTEYLASMDWTKTTAKQDEKTFKFKDLVPLILEVWKYQVDVQGITSTGIDFSCGSNRHQAISWSNDALGSWCHMEFPGRNEWLTVNNSCPFHANTKWLIQYKDVIFPI